MKLIDKGLTREDAYKTVQTAAMNVWNDSKKDLKSEISKSPEIIKYLSEQDINEIFNPDKMLKNVDFIFNRTLEAE